MSKRRTASARLSLAGPGCKGLRVNQRTDFQIPGTQLVYRKKSRRTTVRPRACHRLLGFDQ